MSAKDPRLGRVYEYDPRSTKDYPIRTLELDSPHTNEWNVGVWLNQGSEGACVGFGFGHELNADPERVQCSNDCAFSIYHHAQEVDEWAGNNYDGTSVLAGAKILKELGHYDEYRWAQSEGDIARAVSNVGPVVIGVNWYAEMYDPDEDGFIHPTGSLQGGHCLLVYGINVEEGYYKLWNSWGPEWGDNGTCKISRADMDLLLRNDGEGCLPVRHSSNPVDPQPEPIEPDPEPIVHCGWFCRLWNWLLSKFV